MLEVRSLSKIYGLRYALKDVSFVAQPGRVLGIFGPNGAGKTTLVRILAGQVRPTAGTVSFFGRQASGDEPEVRRHIGVVGHHTFLYDDLTAVENLRFYCRMYGLRLGESELLSRLEEVGLASRAHEPVRYLSRGMQQRLALARATLHNPEILLLDEPYTGLDQSAVALLDSLLARERLRGHSTLLVTHDVEHGLQLADDVLVLVQGRITASGPAQQFSADSVTSFYQSQGEEAR
jgi:heme exporter protein A